MIRVAIAGLSHFHVDYVLREARDKPELIDLVGVADPDQRARQEWAVPGRPCFADYAELIRSTGPDVVAIFAPYDDRAGIVIEALRAGAHVLTDKPLCTTQEQLQSVAQAAASAQRTISTIFEKRWYAETIAVQELITGGAIGRPRQFAFAAPHKLNREERPNWYFDERYGSIVSDLLSHDIDLFLHLSGETSGTLSAARLQGIDPEHPEWADSCALLLTGHHSAATMEADWLWPAASPYHGEYTMKITGEGGAIFVNWARHSVFIITRDQGENAVTLPEAQGPAADSLTAFAEGRSPQVTTSQSLAVAAIGLRAAQSADEQRVLEWSIDQGSV